MKRHIFLLCLLLALLCAAALAEEDLPDRESIDAGDFSYVPLDDGSAMITECHLDWESTLVKLPAKLDGRRVSAIDAYVFTDWYELARVEIPASLTQVGDETFSGLPSLTEIVVAPDNPTLESIDGVLFGKADRRLICYPSGRTAGIYAVPEGTGIIGRGAFAQEYDHFHWLKYVILPEGLTAIEDYAFHSSDPIRIDIPGSVSAIGEDAFMGWEGALVIDPTPFLRDYCVRRALPFALRTDRNWIAATFGAWQPARVAFCKAWISLRAEPSTDAKKLAEIPLDAEVEVVMGAGDFLPCRYQGTTGYVLAEYLSFTGDYFTEAPEGTVSGDFRYDVLDDGSALITAYLGGDAEAIDIPATLDGHSVTAIGSGAFHNLDSLRTVTVPEGVTCIGREAFSDCESLTEVRLPEGLTAIGEDAFHRCLKLAELRLPASLTVIGASAFAACEDLTEVALPESLSALCMYAFYGCKSLTSAWLPEGLTAIGENAFGGCDWVVLTVAEGSAAQDYCLENGLNYTTGAPEAASDFVEEAVADREWISAGDFSYIALDDGSAMIVDCALSMESRRVEIPDALDGRPVTALASHLFSEWYDLAEVVIPEGVAYLGYGAFSMTSLTRVDLPASLTRVAGNPFIDCPALTEIRVSPDNPALTVRDGVLFSMPDKRLVCYPCALTRGVYAVPEGIRIIGSCAFCQEYDGFHYLRNVVLPDSVTTLEDYAFDSCRLVQFYVPDSVTAIDEGALRLFEGTVLVEPGSCAEQYCAAEGIECALRTDDAWDPSKPDVWALAVVDFCETSTPLCRYAYLSPAEADIPVGATVEVALWARDYLPCRYRGSTGYINAAHLRFDGDPAPGELDTPETQAYTYRLQEDGTAMITAYSNWNAERLEVPAALDGHPVTAIGESVFRYNDALTEVVLPEGLRTIGDNAFHSCRALAAIVLPDGLTGIGKNAFSNCDSLVSVELPDSLTALGDYAFYECASLSAIDIPGGVSTIGEYAFAFCDRLTEVRLPEGLIRIGNAAFAYCAALDGVDLPDSLTALGESAFYGCISLSAIAIPDGLDTVEYCAFCMCEGLASVSLPPSLIEIGDYAFGGCKRLTEIALPDSVIEIGEGAFAVCTALTTVSLPDSLTSIPSEAFRDSGLTRVRVPDGVTEIGYRAFALCGDLAEVDLPESLTEIGAGAFRNCTVLTGIVLPAGLTQIGGGAFEGCPRLTLSVAEGSYAHRYCAENGLNCTLREPEIVWMAAEIANCDEWVSLRAEPSAKAARLAKIPLGAAVEILPSDGEFCQCRYQGTTGYVLTRYLKRG